MSEQHDKQQPMPAAAETEAMEAQPASLEREDRRRFLIGLGKWSKVVILGAVGGGALLAERPAQARGSWANRRGGGSWANRNAGGAGWANRRGAGLGGSWVNRR